MNASEVIRTGRDMPYPYREESNFWYLTGFSEPEAILVLVAPENEKPRSILFCTETLDFETAAFNGEACGTQGAKDTYGFDEAYPIEKADEMILDLFAKSDVLYYLVGQKSDWDERIIALVAKTKKIAYRRSKPPISVISDLDTVLSEMRLIKKTEELSLMIKACRFTGGGVIKAMQSCQPGMMEYQLEAKISEWFRFHGCCQMSAFPPIVAGGENATTLHYIENNCPLKDGDLVLTDVGGEFDHYAGDISRTFPVNGKFSPAQKALYEIVLEAQKEAIKQCVAGSSFRDPHKAAVRIITEGLVRLGILHGDVDELIALGLNNDNPPQISYRRFFVHRTSHWLGLDPHDVGNYWESDDVPRILKPGMVLTVEPGIYIKPADDVPKEYWNIGIRIEDDVLIEKFGPPFVLTPDAPKEIDDIETVMSFSR